jgi:hypothetical protein
MSNSSSSSSSSAAGGGGSMNSIPKINYIEASSLIEKLDNAINKSETTQAHDLADELLKQNFETITPGDGTKLINKINSVGTILGKKNFLRDDPLLNKVDTILAKIKNQTQGFGDRGADMRRKVDAALIAAAQQNVEEEYGLKDLEETNQYLLQFSREIAEYATLHAAILDAKRKNNEQERQKLEAEAKIREAAIDAAITAQQAIRKNSIRAKLLSGKLSPDVYFDLEKKTDEKIKDLGKKEQTLAVQAETAYVKKIKNYVEAWKEILPSLAGVARTILTGILVPDAAAGISNLVGLRSAVASSGLVPVSASSGIFNSLVVNAALNGFIQVGSLAGLVYLATVYGPSFVDSMKNAINLADEQLGDFLNYIARIVRPVEDNAQLMIGIGNHGPSEYEAGDYSRMDQVAQQIIPEQIQNELARLAATTPIPGGNGTLTGADVLQAAADGNREAQQQVAEALDQVASRAPSRAGTTANSASNSQQEDYSSFGFGLGGRRRKQRRSTKKRPIRRRRSTKRRRYTKKRRSTKRRQTKRRR